MKTFVTAVFAAFLIGGLANAQVVVIDDVFGDGNPETNTDGTVAAGIDGTYYIVASDGGVVTEGTGIPEVTEPGPLKFDPSANGNWARGELISKQDFPLPTAGETRTFSWTIGPVTPSSVGVGGDDYRIQLNAINADRTQDTAGDGIGRDSERFVLDGTDSGASAISLDMYFEEDNAFLENGVLLAQLWEKDSTWAVNTNGVQLCSAEPCGADLNFGIGTGGTEWDWWVDPNTFSLTMTDTGYTWSDSVTGFEFSRDYTAQTAADFASGYWAYTHGQNRDSGRGSHELSRFMVTETGGGVTGDFNGDGNWDCADIDALTADIAAGTNTVDPYDLTEDGLVNLDDQIAWLAEAGSENGLAGPYLPGDANLSGGVDVSDFNVYNQNAFTTNTAWCGGNFNGSAETDVSDFNIWNGSKFTNSGGGVNTVPEPAGLVSMLMLLVGLMLLPLRRSRRNRG